MPKASCGLDRLYWYKVDGLIKEISAQSNLIITIYDQNNHEQSKKSDEVPAYPALGKAHRKKRRCPKSIIGSNEERQPHHRNCKAFPDWHDNSTINSIAHNSTEFCAENLNWTKEVVLQQVVQPPMAQGILSSCRCSTTAGLCDSIEDFGTRTRSSYQTATDPTKRFPNRTRSE